MLFRSLYLSELTQDVVCPVDIIFLHVLYLSELTQDVACPVNIIILHVLYLSELTQDVACPVNIIILHVLYLSERTQDVACPVNIIILHVLHLSERTQDVAWYAGDMIHERRFKLRVEPWRRLWFETRIILKTFCFACTIRFIHPILFSVLPIFIFKKITQSYVYCSLDS